MNIEKFNICLVVAIIPKIIDLIVANSNITEWQAIKIFYHTKLYRDLSDESTKLWHFSPLLLYTLLQDELLTGHYEYPEVGL